MFLSWCARGGEVLREPIPRRRLLIVLAGFLVCGYALSVLFYVLSVPDIGLRCVFTPTITRVFPGYCYPEPEHQTIPERGDTIVQVGDQRVEDNWLQYLRKLME